jgi:cutinase
MVSTSASRRARLLAVSLAALALAGTASSCSRLRGGAPSGGGARPPISRPAGGGQTGGGGGLPSGGGETGGGAPGGGQPGGGGAPGGGQTGGGSAGCPSVEIVTARGTGENQKSAGGLAGLNQGIAAQVPGTKIYQVVYPATADFLNSAAVGTKDALEHITATAGQCANTRFFLTGYSQGGMVMTGVFQKLPANVASKVIGGVLYGNPYYKAGSPTAAGPDKSAQGIIPGGIPASWGGKVHDYCVVGDTVCGSGSKGGTGLPAAGISAAHMTYPRSALEREATTWAVGVIKGA